MRAAVFHAPGRIGAEEAAMPSIAANEVLVQVAACGICGSDLHMYRTDTHRDLLVRRTEAGQEIPGHEFAGVIVKTGSDVNDYRVGERVVGVGMGGMAEYVPVPVNPFQLARIPDGVSFEEAATTEPLADGLQILRLARPQSGENIVVFGVGIIGLGVVQALRASETKVGRIIAIDVSAPRLAMARELGATHAIDASAGDPVAQVGALCGWQSGYGVPEAPDVHVVIDCAGYLRHMKGPPPLQSALDMLRPSGGRLICFGAFEGRMELDLMPVIHKQMAIHGSNGYGAGELDEALALMATGRVDRRKLISHRFPLERVGEAFEVQGGGQAIKVLLLPDAA
jgi:threonine dehydrogenase-like Zn-dependent dehydrogenase